MIKLFKATDKLYSSNGDLVLNPSKASVHKEDNGAFYLDLETPLSEKKEIFREKEAGTSVEGTTISANNVDLTKMSSIALKGQSYQTTTTQSINIFNLTSISMSTGSATLTNGEITLTWSGGFNLDLSNEITGLDTTKTYTISFKHKGNALYLRNKSVDPNLNKLVTNNDNDYTLYSYTVSGISAFSFRFVRKDSTGTAYLKDIQVEEGSSATPYVPYSPNSPSPDHPQPIESTTGNQIITIPSSKNLFNKLTAQIGYYYGNGTIGTSGLFSKYLLNQIHLII